MYKIKFKHTGKIKRFKTLRNADLHYADLSNMMLDNVDLFGATLYCADMSGTSLKNANLQFVDFQNADLEYADLENADLQYANLKHTNLQFTNLKNADLRHTNLDFASFPLSCKSFFLIDNGDIVKQLLSHIARIKIRGDKDLQKWVNKIPKKYKNAICKKHVVKEV